MPDHPPIGHFNKARARSPFKVLGYGCAIVLTVTVAAQAYYVFAGNFHTVLPGRVYRCGQLSGKALEQVITEKHIRTVVNLRGYSPALPWYLEECRATHHLNVAQEDICFSATRLPAIDELHRLVEVLDRTEYPILLHCRHGADRTGLASAVVWLLEPNLTFREARDQLSVQFGHIPWGRLKYLDRFFDLYSEWLNEHGLTHSPSHFRKWISTEDFPGEGRCRVEALEWPEKITCGEPGSFRVRIHNTGRIPWQFKAGTNAGYHAGFILFDDEDHTMVFGRAGLLDALVPPGKSIDVTIVLPVIRTPGNYRVLVDIVDEQQGWFYQLGCEPWEHDVVVVSNES